MYPPTLVPIDGTAPDDDHVLYANEDGTYDLIRRKHGEDVDWLGCYDNPEDPMIEHAINGTGACRR